MLKKVKYWTSVGVFYHLTTCAFSYTNIYYVSYAIQVLGVHFLQHLTLKFWNTVRCWSLKTGLFALAFHTIVIQWMHLKRHTTLKLRSWFGRKHLRWLAFRQMPWKSSSLGNPFSAVMDNMRHSRYHIDPNREVVVCSCSWLERLCYIILILNLEGENRGSGKRKLSLSTVMQVCSSLRSREFFLLSKLDIVNSCRNRLPLLFVITYQW